MVPAKFLTGCMLRVDGTVGGREKGCFIAGERSRVLLSRNSIHRIGRIFDGYTIWQFSFSLLSDVK